jgi:hypothetical protein
MVIVIILVFFVVPLIGIGLYSRRPNLLSPCYGGIPFYSIDVTWTSFVFPSSIIEIVKNEAHVFPSVFL